MNSRSKLELPNPSSSAQQRARVLGRGTGVALTLTLLAACGGTPELVADGASDPTATEDSAATEGDSHLTTPTPDSGARAVADDGALRPSGPRAAAVARTRSYGKSLDGETRKQLVKVGRIEHTFSNGRTIEFINSEAGNFGIGDIILGKTDELADYVERVENDPETISRSLIHDDDDDTWPGGVIQYSWDGTLSFSDREAVNAAVAEWNRVNPYVKWVRYTGNGDWVEFMKVVTTEYCGRSVVGRSFSFFGGQDLEIASNCFTNRTILHEMGHAAGLKHEHQRCGRNAFVTVNGSPRGTDYDELCGDTRNYGDYDFASIMHYGASPTLTINQFPTSPFMGLPSSAGASRLSQDDVNGVTWFHTKRVFSTTVGQGFAWSSQLTGSSAASTNFAFNQLNGTGTRATITNVGTGRYQVDYPKLGKEAGGNVQVTAYGSDPGRCKVESWSSVGETLRVMVRCFALNGLPANRLFATSYQRLTSPASGVQGGYVYSNRLAEDGAYTPDVWYQWNSAGQRNKVTHPSTGRYTVAFPGINVVGGTVRLTAHGTTSDYCTIESWGNSAVSVGCFDTSGNPKDSAFSLAFTDRVFTGSYAYAWADSPSSARYEPMHHYQKAQIVGSSTPVATKIVINRNSAGDYRVEIPGVAAFSSNVSVSAYGFGNNNSCNVVNWGPAASVGPNLADRRENVNVRCFNPSGTPTDSRFAITYMTNEFIIP